MPNSSGQRPRANGFSIASVAPSRVRCSPIYSALTVSFPCVCSFAKPSPGSLNQETHQSPMDNPENQKKYLRLNLRFSPHQPRAGIVYDSKQNPNMPAYASVTVAVVSESASADSCQHKHCMQHHKNCWQQEPSSECGVSVRHFMPNYDYTIAVRVSRSYIDSCK